MSIKYYILKDKQPVHEPDVLKWGLWFSTANRIVQKTTATVKVNGQNVGRVDISTVFTGIQFGEEQDVFETVVFGGPLDQECDRCSTWQAAEKMHEKMVEKVRYAVDTMEV